MWVIIIAVLGLAVGGWVAWRLLQARSSVAVDLPAPLGQLAHQLRTAGVVLDAGRVKKGHWPGVQDRAIFQVLEPQQRVFFVAVFDTAEHAAERLSLLRQAPSPNLALHQGRCVLYATDWPADALWQQVAQAFSRTGGC